MTNPPFILEHLPAVGEVLRDPRVFSYLHVPVRCRGPLPRAAGSPATACLQSP